MLTKGYKETEIGVIPDDWEVKQLDEIVIFKNGKGHEQVIDENGQYIVINSKFISTDGKIYKSSNSNLSPLKKHDITMVMSDIPNGKALAKYFYVDKDNKYTLNQRICSLTAIKDNSRFLFYRLNRNRYFLKFNDGVNQTNLRKNEVLECKIPLPPLKEQEKIADILSTADEKIDAIGLQIQKAEILKKGLLQKLLSEGIEHTKFKDSELGKIPESWEVVNVENITDTHKQGYYTKDEYTGKGTYLIRITDLGNPKINYSDMPMLPISDNDYKSFKVRKGDFLFARSGAIGRYGIVYENYNAVFASYLIRFTFHQDKVINEYFGYFYETKKAINQLLSITQGSSNININANNIKSIKLALPPLKEQKQIADILSTTDEKLEVLRAKKEKYETLKKGLLQKLLSGEVRV